MLNLSTSEKESLIELISVKLLTIREKIVAAEWTVGHTFNDFVREACCKDLEELKQTREKYDVILGKLEFYQPRRD